ncbi:MAG: anthrone oxygenase family protein [Longimicrobiaceae bacterium]
MRAQEQHRCQGRALLTWGTPAAYCCGRRARPSLTGYRQALTWLVIAALVLYASAFLVTMAYNVPLNREFDSVSLSAVNLTAERSAYEDRWNTGNLIRTLLSISAIASLAVALVLERLGRAASESGRG